MIFRYSYLLWSSFSSLPSWISVDAFTTVQFTIYTRRFVYSHICTSFYSMSWMMIILVTLIPKPSSNESLVNNANEKSPSSSMKKGLVVVYYRLNSLNVWFQVVMINSLWICDDTGVLVSFFSSSLNVIRIGVSFSSSFPLSVFVLFAQRS